jgi:hypothetical protein
MKRKVVDDVLGGEETWRDADSTAGRHLLSFRMQEVGMLNHDQQSLVTSVVTHARISISYRLDLQMSL